VGTLWNGGVTLFETTGASEHVPFPDPVTTNICFGGADMQGCVGHLLEHRRLYKVRWPRPGLKLAFNA
jgi:gluconolactonase